MKKTKKFILLVMVVGLLLSACGGTEAESNNQAEEPVEQAPVEEAAAEEDMDTSVTVLSVDVEQSGETVFANEWDTEWSVRLGITLEEVFDSSGDAAWDPAAHPLVYVSSEGPGYSGFISEVTTPGFMIMDANSYEVVASAHFDLGWDEYFEPHGSGVSPGGEWIYIPTGTSSSFGAQGGGRLLIINAKTFKLDRILGTGANPHHVKSFVDAEGRELVMVSNFGNSTFYVLDPNDNNRVVGGIDGAALKGNGYLQFAHPSGQYIFITVRTPFGSEGGVAVVDTQTWTVKASIDTLDTSPIYVAFSADGNAAYVSGGHSSSVVKLDISAENPRAWSVVGYTSAGTLGPYGITLNWDETQLWVIGKGEGAHNRGNTAGLIDPTVMTMPPRAWAPGSKGSFYTDCLRGDHGIVHPDPEANEMWISCNASFNTIIWSFETMSIIANLPTPNGGSTHNGSFVLYNPDFTGEVLSDQNGLQGSALELKLEIIAEQATNN